MVLTQKCENRQKHRFCGFREVLHHGFDPKNAKIVENIDFAVLGRYQFMVSALKMRKSSKTSILRFWGGTTSWFRPQKCENHRKHRFCGFREVPLHDFGPKNEKIIENIDFAVIKRYYIMISALKI